MVCSLCKILFYPSYNYLRERFECRLAMGDHLRSGTNLFLALPPHGSMYILQVKFSVRVIWSWLSEVPFYRRGIIRAHINIYLPIFFCVGLLCFHHRLYVLVYCMYIQFKIMYLLAIIIEYAALILCISLKLLCLGLNQLCSYFIIKG